MAFKKGNKHGNRFSRDSQPPKENVGRPRKLPKLEEILANVLGEEKSGITAAEAIIKALMAKAARGDVKAATLLLERGWGKPKQVIDLEGHITETIITKRVIEKGDKRD